MKNLIDSVIEAILGPFVPKPAPQRAVVPVRTREKEKAPWKG